MILGFMGIITIISNFIIISSYFCYFIPFLNDSGSFKNRTQIYIEFLYKVIFVILSKYFQEYKILINIFVLTQPIYMYLYTIYYYYFIFSGFSLIHDLIDNFFLIFHLEILLYQIS